MPRTMFLYMIGAFAISAVPLFSGFVSKAMVVSAAGESHRAALFLLLTMASAGTFLHTGLKLPYYMFFGKDKGIAAQEPPSNMLAAMALAAGACILIGVAPGLLYRHLPFAVDYAPYTVHHVIATLGLLGFTALGFFLLLPQLDPKPTISLDTDWFYRRGAGAFMRWGAAPLLRFEQRVVGEIYEFFTTGLVLGVSKILRKLDQVVVDGAANGVGRLTQAASRWLRPMQTGNAQDYGLAMAAGLIVAMMMAAVLQ